MVKRVGKYEMGRTLGEGTFGKVKYAINVETGEAVAIKVLDKEKIQKQNMGNQIKKEISIMKMVIHKYIVGLIEVLASKTKIFIVLELITGGELFDKIVSAGRLSEEQAKFYFAQLVEGVDYCHKQGVCHRDLKPENLLLDEHGNLKISDFGLSSLYVGDAEGDGATRTQLLHTTCGTPNYVAPEVLSDQGYDGKKADVWSIGVILYVLLAGFLPFDESTIVALFNKIKSAEFTYPSWFSAEVKSLIDIMLVADPRQRITLGQVMEHPWLKGSLGQSTPRPLAVSPVQQPSAGQVSQAVQPAAVGVKSASDEHDHDEHDDDDDEGTPRQPRTLNAFEVIAMCGGFYLDKLFSPHIFVNTAASSSVASSSSASASGGTGDIDAAGVLRFGSQRRTNAYQYTSSVCPPSELIRNVYDALDDMGFSFTTSKEAVCQSGKLQCTFLSCKGMVAFIIQAYALCPTLTLLDIKRGKGDILEWNKIFKELIDEKIPHLLNKPSASGESKDNTV